MGAAFERAAYHENLPQRIREYLRLKRGISDEMIDRHFLGWDGRRITIPIFDREGKFAFFKLAKDPDDLGPSPKMLAPPGTRAELYGWERVLEKPEQLIICEGEYDRLVLESQGLASVTSTGGANTFRRSWAEAFREIPTVYVCFDQDRAGDMGAKKVSRLIPHARIVELPEEVGEGGDVTDLFVRLHRNREEFGALLEKAAPLPEQQTKPEDSPALASRSNFRTEIDDLKIRVRIEEIARQYLELQPSGPRLIGRCPFHDDQHPSFVVYPDSQSFYCFGCQAYGDVITFLMQIEHLTFSEALDVLRKIGQQAA